MNSLFRSIRMNLLNENKTYKYLKYAIGEIVLIIVGIMIALQLNNWNEDRKAQAEFINYLIQLNADVRKAIKKVDDSRAIMEDFMTNGEYALTFLELSKYESEELAAFEKGLNYLRYVNQPQVYVGLLGQLMNGDMDTIGRDQDLAQEALNMESSVEMMLTNIQRNGSQIKLITANQLSKLIGFGIFRESKPPLYDLDQLKSSNEFVYAAYSI